MTTFNEIKNNCDYCHNLWMQGRPPYANSMSVQYREFVQKELQNIVDQQKNMQKNGRAEQEILDYCKKEECFKARQRLGASV